MSIYRAEQVQFSMASEPGPGGMLDYVSAATDPALWTALINMAGHLASGSRSLVFDGATEILTVGNYISIGTTATGNQEVRKITGVPPTGTHNGGANASLIDTTKNFLLLGVVVGDTLLNVTTTGTTTITAINTTTNPNDTLVGVLSLPGWTDGNAYRFTSGTIYLDQPTGFFHRNNEALDEKTVPDATYAGDSFVTFLPGVYETITTPDLQPEILPQYFLGTTSTRNPYIFLKGRQTFTGTLSNFILLNGYPLRFPFGSIRTVASAISGGASTLAAGTDYYKGERAITITVASTFANGEYIEIERGGTNPEVRQIISGGGTTTLVLNYPLMFAHATGVTVSECTVGTTFTHTVVQTDALDSMTWHVRMKDSSSTDDTGGISWQYSNATPTNTNSLARRWIGGKVGRATLSAEEGGMVVMSWDEVPFLDEIHNQRYHSSVGAGAVDISKFSAAILNPDGIGGAIPWVTAAALGTPTLPITEPYYFSEGSISFFGVTFARIRNFRIDINNNLEPRYYIRDQATERIPSEFIEQRREYRMTATVALPDSLASTATTRSLFKELLLEGNYGSGMQGFDISLVFTRAVGDTITITIPPAAAATGGDAQGAFIVRASHEIGTESPIQCDLEMLLRSMSIVITDSIPVYP